MKNRHFNPKLLFWAYLSPVAVISLLLFIWSAFVAADIIPNKAGTAFARDPWLRMAFPLVFAVLSIVSSVAIILYRKGEITWAHWTIGAGVVYTGLFTWLASKSIMSFSIKTLYFLCIALVNIVCIVELFNYILWRRRSEGEYHVVDKNDEGYVRYSGSYEDCLRLFEIEYDDFKQTHKIISDRKLTRIIKRERRYLC